MLLLRNIAPFDANLGDNLGNTTLSENLCAYLGNVGNTSECIGGRLHVG